MKTQTKRTFDEINITPLTDIFLVLLIIMMVVAPLLEYRGLNVALLSDTPAPPSKEKPKITRVVIDAEGRYTIDGQNVAADELCNVIRRDAAEHPEGVLMEVHPDASFESLTRVVDATNEAGVKNMSVVENNGEVPRPPAPPKPTKTKRP